MAFVFRPEVVKGPIRVHRYRVSCYRVSCYRVSREQTRKQRVAFEVLLWHSGMRPPRRTHCDLARGVLLVLAALLYHSHFK
jgi:hypothetical protein